MNGLKFVNRAGSLPSTIWARARLTRFTALYLIFIVVSSITQIGLRSYTLARDSSAHATLETHLVAGRARTGGIPILSSPSSIEICQTLAFPGEDSSCRAVWSPATISAIAARQDVDVVSNRVCLESLNYPVYVLREDIREDSVTLALQFFSLGLGIFAMAQNHISHFATGTLVQIISVAWASIRVRDTGISAADFDRVITNGACGNQLLGNFWEHRWGLDVAVLAIDILFSLLSFAFSFKAAQNLGLTNMQSSKLSPRTNHVYKVMIAALISIELSMFFAVAAGAIWLEQIFFLEDVSGQGMGAKAMYGIAEVLMVPLLFLGWVSLHREMWKSVLTFLGCSFVYLAGWGLTFLIEPFRWSVDTWNLFGFLAIFSTILAFTTFVCTLISACYFGKGMKKLSDVDHSTSDKVHTIQSFQFRTSDDESFAEKGEYSIKHSQSRSIDSMDNGVIAPVPTLGYHNAGNGQPRIPKHKATAMARGLTVSPPPLQ